MSHLWAGTIWRLFIGRTCLRTHGHTISSLAALRTRSAQHHERLRVARMERCPCHGMLQAKYRKHVPASVARREFGDEWASIHAGLACPLRGCWSAELAAGDILVELTAAFDDAFAGFMLAVRPRVTAQEWASILRDYERAKGQTIYDSCCANNVSL